MRIVGNLADFASYLEKELTAEVKDIAVAKSNTVAKFVLQELTETTPVDTSKALSNWRVNVGNPVRAEIEAHFLGQRGSTREQSALETVAIGVRQLAARKYGEAIFISNNADYIEDLNRGTSRQQPKPGFVERAVERGIALARGKL